jgi:hypothetical protein
LAGFPVIWQISENFAGIPGIFKEFQEFGRNLKDFQQFGRKSRNLARFHVRV